MIEAHLLDSWTRFPDRQTGQFAYAMVLGGFGAPLFLFLAGVAVPLSAGSKARRTGDIDGASRAVVRRGLEVFGLAFLFRIQAWVLGWSSPRSLLKVDILNIMGPSIMAAAVDVGSAAHREGTTGRVCRSHAGRGADDANRAEHVTALGAARSDRSVSASGRRSQ